MLCAHVQTFLILFFIVPQNTSSLLQTMYRVFGVRIFPAFISRVEFRRCVAHRGAPRKILSDNEKQFVKAE